MSWAALRWAETVNISSLPGDPSTNRLMLILLARRAGDCGHAYPNQAMLAATMGKSRRTIIGVVEDLLAAGLIAVYHRNRLGERHRSNIYRVQFPDPVAGDDCPGCDADRDTLPISAPNGNAPQVQPVAHVEVQPVAHVHTRTSDNPNPEVQPEEKNKTARDHSSDPQWLVELHEIPAWSCHRDVRLMERVKIDAVDASVLLRTALALVAKWDPKKWKDPAAAFRVWLRNEPDHVQESRSPSAGPPLRDPDELIEAYLFTDDRGVEPLVAVGRKPRREVDSMTETWHPPEPTPQLGNGGVMGIAHKGRWRPQPQTALPEAAGAR